MSTKSRIVRPDSMGCAASRPSAWGGEASEQGSDDPRHPALPRLLVRARIGGDAGQQRVAVLVPLAAGIVMTEHGGGAARLVDDAEREIALGQAVQCFRDMGGRLIFVDDAAKAVDSREVLAPLLVPAPDLHLFPGEVVAGEVELQPRIARVAALGAAPDDLDERLERLIGRLLVAADIDDLDIVAERLEVIGIGGVAVAGMELDEAVERDDRLIVFLRF